LQNVSLCSQPCLHESHCWWHHSQVLSLVQLPHVAQPARHENAVLSQRSRQALGSGRAAVARDAPAPDGACARVKSRVLGHAAR